MTDTEFLQWIHARLETVHGENPNVDYMQKLKSMTVTKPDMLNHEALYAIAIEKADSDIKSMYPLSMNKSIEVIRRRDALIYKYYRAYVTP